jgi:hypothetical protein
LLKCTWGPQTGFKLEVEGDPKSGSIEVFVHFFHPAVELVKQIGDSHFLQGLAVISALTGFSAKDIGKSLIWVFKKLKGRPINNETELASILPDNLPIDSAEFIRIYNDPEVQAAIRAAIRSLRKEGYETFETRANSKVLESVSKADVLAVEAAEMDAIITNEDKVLDIEKASFVQHLAWHLSDDGKPFDAKIEDPLLWQQIASGDRFGYGDRLHVTLHTEAEREASGRLRVTRTVTKVHRIDRPGGAQISLFPQPVIRSESDEPESI